MFDRVVLCLAGIFDAADCVVRLLEIFLLFLTVRLLVFGYLLCLILWFGFRDI